MSKQKLIKIHLETKEELNKLIFKIEKRQPYLKGSVSYNAIILMLMGKKKIKLSKYKILKEVEKLEIMEEIK